VFQAGDPLHEPEQRRLSKDNLSIRLLQRSNSTSRSPKDGA
jgi:hypothetical protein